MNSGSRLYIVGVRSLMHALAIISCWMIVQPTIAFAQSPKEVLSALAEVSDSPFLGSSKAAVKIHVFSDLRCGMCGYVYKNSVPGLKTEYADKGLIELVFLDFPLGYGGPSTKLAEAARCAASQGKTDPEKGQKYLDYVTLLFDKNTEGSKEDLVRFAEELSLDKAVFEQCLVSEEAVHAVKQDSQLGERLGISGTPTIYLNGQEIGGALPFEEFKKLIDEALKKSK